MAYSDRASPLARYLLLAYALLIVYASLNPFSGWRDSGAPLLDFLLAPLPRYIVTFEVAANLAAYVPLGFLGVLAIHPRWRGKRALLAAAAFSALLSLGLEALQNYLQSRIASNVDWVANSLGGISGAVLGSLFSNHLLRDEALQALRYRLFQEGEKIDLGLVLLGLWLLTLLYPGTSLFGNGDLRAIFSAPVAELHPGELFMRFEASVTAINTLAVGMLMALLAGRNQPVHALFIALMVAALMVRTVAYGVLFSSQSLFDWLTPGATFGLAAGVLMTFVAVMFPRPLKVMVCGLSLMAGTAIVNIAPENPYFLAALSTWQQGHFLNFNGFTRLLSTAWPFAAVLYVLGLASSRSAERH
jgi:VanZ family protein